MGGEDGLWLMVKRWMRWEYVPALTVIFLVAVFWTAGALGWLSVLTVSGSPLAVLVWMYVMLAAVAASIILGGAAIFDLVRRTRRRT